MKRKGMASGTMFVATNKRRRNTGVRRTIPKSITFSRSNRQSGAIGKFSSNAFRRGEEIKTLDLNFTGAYAAGYTADSQPQQRLNTNTNTACVQALNLIQQGAGISQRIGNKVSLKSARLRFNIIPTANNLDYVTNVRVMLLYDRNPNGAYVAANNILGNSLQSNTIGAGSYLDNINPNFFDRFVVLMDKFLALPPYEQGAVSASDITGCTEISAFHIDEFINLKNLESQYNGTANPITIAYMNIGSLLLLSYGSALPGADPWCLYGTVRLRFRDN